MEHSRRRWTLRVAASTATVLTAAVVTAALAGGSAPTPLALAARTVSIPAPAVPSATPAHAVPSTTPSAAASTAAPTPALRATPVASGSTAGPLFTAGLSSAHTCTASVVDSSAGDMILTAAHCISGTGVGDVFAPGYADGATPFGTWTVTGAYASSAWLTGQDTQADYVFLTVRPSGTNATAAPVQQVVGGNPLGAAPAAGTTITATGYAKGLDDEAITCTTPTDLTSGFPAFTCGSFPGGTSGGPWVTTAGSVVGVIGGLHQGGCTVQTSYSAAFTPATAAVLEQAEAAAKPDTLPPAGSDGC